jgi:serine/threonine protein phosphatase PrpC
VHVRNGIAVWASRDHKADRQDEVDRVRRSGGYVLHKRVMGELAISRALGDADFKTKGVPWQDQIVLAAPETHTAPLDSDTEFFIIACDGLVRIRCHYALMIHAHMHTDDGR